MCTLSLGQSLCRQSTRLALLVLSRHAEGDAQRVYRWVSYAKAKSSEYLSALAAVSAICANSWQTFAMHHTSSVQEK